MVEKLERHVLVGGVAPAELERHAQHVEAEHRHPSGAVGLLDIAAGGEWAGTIEYPDVIKAKEPALEEVHPFGVFSVHPPGEIQQQLVEDALQEFEIAAAAALIAVVLEYAHGGPRVHRRIDVEIGRASCRERV